MNFKKDINKWARSKIFNGSVVMIKPDFDASDKQIFAKNNFRTNSENIEMFLEKKRSGGEDVFFKPKYLGDFSRKNDGNVILRSENPAAVDIDF